VLVFVSRAIKPLRHADFCNPQTPRLKYKAALAVEPGRLRITLRKKGDRSSADHKHDQADDEKETAMLFSPAHCKPQEQFADETPAQQRDHRLIARRYAWDDRQRRERGRYPSIVIFRLRDLENLFAYRYGPTLPDDDAGREDLYVAASHIFRIGHPEEHIPAWARLWCPWLGKEECDKLIADVARRREWWKAKALGRIMRLDAATRDLLGITTFRAIDQSENKRTRRRKKQDAARHRALRAKGGAKPHAMSAARTKPWLALGISRRTWYRNRRNGTVGTNSSAADKPLRGEDETVPRHAAARSTRGSGACAVAGTDGVFMLPREAISRKPASSI
jgi:hypothetical protein